MVWSPNVNTETPLSEFIFWSNIEPVVIKLPETAESLLLRSAKFVVKFCILLCWIFALGLTSMSTIVLAGVW